MSLGRQSLPTTDDDDNHCTGSQPETASAAAAEVQYRLIDPPSGVDPEQYDHRSPLPRSGHSMHSLGGGAYVVFGGLAYQDEPLNDAWRLDLTERDMGLPDDTESLFDIPATSVAEPARRERVDAARVGGESSEWDVRWSPLSPAPRHGTFGHAACLFDGGRRLFVHGGMHLQCPVSEACVLRMDGAEWVWEKVTVDLAARWGHSVSATRRGGREVLVLFGGDSEDAAGVMGSTADLCVIDPSDWSVRRVEAAPLWPAPRRRHVACLAAGDTALVVFGGRNNRWAMRLADDFFDDTWLLRLADLTWIPITPETAPSRVAAHLHRPPTPDGPPWPLPCIPHNSQAFGKHVTIPPPRTGGAATVVDGRMLLFGGFFMRMISPRRAEYHNYCDIHLYDLRTNTWERAPTPRVGPDHNLEDAPPPITMSTVLPLEPVAGHSRVLIYGGRIGDVPSNYTYVATLRPPVCPPSLAGWCADWFLSPVPPAAEGAQRAEAVASSPIATEPVAAHAVRLSAARGPTRTTIPATH